MRSSRPDVVFHLAAYKHVDMGEMFPDHYVSNNVLATWRLARLAITGGVARFVYPSSDKAVHPCSVYGATKRAVELGLSSLNSSLSTSRFLLARLVNVLGARGGVFETLITQASNGQSLTLTHPEMTRFWITEGEAIRLLAWAATTSEAGDCFELNCGEAVSLQAVARALWERYCPSGQEFSVNYIGPRPGERLEEVLWSTTETCEPCETSGIVRIQGDRSSLWSSSDIDTEFALWGRLIDEGNLDELSRRLQQLTGAYFATPPRNG
jgi:FlaA1/EpsC-like NDP-sugar epimerase